MLVQDQLTTIALRLVVELARVFRSASFAELAAVEHIAESLAASLSSSPAALPIPSKSTNATSGEAARVAQHLGGPNGITRLEQLPATREQWIAFIDSVYESAAKPATSASAPILRRQSARDQRIERIAALMRANPSADVASIAKKVGLSQATVYRALHALGAGRRRPKRRQS